MTEARTIWLTDANGAEVEGEASMEALDALLRELRDADEEHATVSVTDSDEWNLEFGAASVLLENVGPEGEEVGTLPLGSATEARAIAREFLEGRLRSAARPTVGALSTAASTAGRSATGSCTSSAPAPAVRCR